MMVLGDLSVQINGKSVCRIGGGAMPMRLELYPQEWNEIARAVKSACDWQCQECGLQCRRPGEPFDTHRRTLTVAHLWPEDHAPDAPIVFVAALCARCHLRADAERKARERAVRRGNHENA